MTLTTTSKFGLVLADETDNVDYLNHIRANFEKLDSAIRDRGSNTIQASVAGDTPLLIRAATGQTARLLEVRDDSNTLLGGFDALGRLRLDQTNDVSLASTGHALQIGVTSDLNIAMDNNELQARNNGAASAWNINQNGGAVNIGGAVTITKNDATHAGIVSQGAFGDLGIQFFAGSPDQVRIVNRAMGGFADLRAAAITGTTITYTTLQSSSDSRAKRNIMPPWPRFSIDTILNNPAYLFKYIDDEEGEIQRIGPMADAFPADMVIKDADGFKYLSLGNLVGILWHAVEQLLKEKHGWPTGAFPLIGA